ncbi:LCP family protein required for cell wall assembly [Anaerotaenia torta]|uniref:LCP family protein n=1 Tax=Anaerotaenia torta TaxID=433293 RepID=UPI003D1C1495
MARERKRKKKGKLYLVLFFEVFAILSIFAIFYINGKMSRINYVNVNDHSIQKNEVEIKTEGYRSIALFGVDSRSNALEKNTHSDTIMIVSINNKTKDIKLASIYRDTYVNIPGEGYDKINAAYFKGGYSLALSTINRNFDLDISEFVTVNFAAIVNVIDILGGIELDIAKNELKYLNGYVRELNKINSTQVSGLKSAGTQLVNGTQATAYARIRYTSGDDFKRTERQRIVIQKILDKVKDSDLSTVNSIVDEMLPQIYTNLTAAEILALVKDVFSYDIVDNTGFPFEKDAHNYKKVSYVFPINLQENVVRLHEFLYDKTGYTPSSTVMDYSSYVEGIRTSK